MNGHSERIDLKIYIIFLLIVGLFGYIVAKDISLPRETTLPFAILGVMAIFYLSFTKPQIALLFLTAYLPFSKVLIGQFGSRIVGLNLTNILLIIVIMGWIFNSVSNGKTLLVKSALNLMVALFCLWGLLSLFWAKYLYASYYDMESFFILFKRWITPIFLYYVTLNMVRDKDTFRKIIFVMMLATFIVSLMAIRDYMNAGTGSLESSRVGGVFEQPNTLGGFFVYNMFFFAAFLFYYWKSLKYWLLLIPFLTCFRGIMVTFSRGAYLACGFGGFMLTFFRSKILFVMATALLIFALLNPAILPQGIQYRLASTFGGKKVISAELEDITDASAGKRLLLWQGAIEMIKDQPLFGFGYGVFPSVIGLYVPQLPFTDAHNTYLILAAEMGIPALLIFLIILVMLIKNAWWLLARTKDKYFKAFALGMLGGMFGLIAVNMFGSRLNSEEVSAYFWMYAGLVMAAVRMRQEGKIE